MDLFFPRDEQRLLFEKLDSTHSLKIPVSQLLEHYRSNSSVSDLGNSSRSLSTTQQSVEEIDIKDLILSKIDQQRETSKLAESPRQTRLQLVRALRNLDPNSTGQIEVDQLKWALGSQYLNLNLSPDEVETTIRLSSAAIVSKKVQSQNDEGSQKRTVPGDQLVDYQKFVRQLNIRNTDPICDPFFDRRANQITRLKQRIHGLNEFSNDEAILHRRDELNKICMVGPGPDGLEKYLDPNRPTTQFRELSPSPLLRNCQSQPSLQRTISGGGSFMYDNGPSSPPIQQSDPSLNASPLRYPSHSSPTHQPPEESDEADKQIRTGFFRATVNAPARTYVKYPMTVDVSKAHGDHKEVLRGGKKHGPEQPFQEKLLHHDNSVAPSLYRYESEGKQITSSGRVIEEKKWMNLSQSLPNLSLSASQPLQSLSAYPSQSSLNTSSLISTNEEYYTPLDYQPSKPVSRPGVIGDAMKCALERDVRIDP